VAAPWWPAESSMTKDQIDLESFSGRAAGPLESDDMNVKLAMTHFLANSVSWSLQTILVALGLVIGRSFGRPWFTSPRSLRAY